MIQALKQQQNGHQVFAAIRQATRLLQALLACRSKLCGGGTAILAVAVMSVITDGGGGEATLHAVRGDDGRLEAAVRQVLRRSACEEREHSGGCGVSLPAFSGAVAAVGTSSDIDILSKLSACPAQELHRG